MKLKTLIYTAGVLFFMTIVGGNMQCLSIHAETTNETESNDTAETANTILENKSTPAGYLSGNDTNQHVISGYTSISDEDWFKVYLSSGEKYMTCNADNYGKGFEYTIYSALDMEFIYNHTYIKNEFGPIAKELTIPSNGYYYVKIQGQEATRNSYLFAIGNPTYSGSSCEINCDEGSVTMSQETVTANFNGYQVTGLPDQAIAYTIRMDGLHSNSVNSITLLNTKSNKSCALQKYTWQKTGLVSLNMDVCSNWKATFTRKNTVIFSPILKVYYVYPVTDKVIQND